MMMRFHASAVGMVLLVWIVGCGERDEVRQYEASRDATAAPPVSASTPATEGEQRLLGAITLYADKTWFFKLSGPAEAVGAQAENFHAFVHSLTFSESADKPVAWTLPEHWHDEPGSEFRYATIRIGHDEPGLELSVTAFPGEAGGLMANLNRWRGQIGLGEITDPEELKSVAESHQVNGKDVIEVDMQGPGGRAPTPLKPQATEAPAAPFAHGAPPASSQNLGPVIDKSPEDSPIVYKIPEGWREHAPGGIRTASFSVGPLEAPAATTVIALGGPAGGLAANVNRWRGQVGLDAVTPEEVETSATKIEVDGAAAYHVDLTGAERSIVGVIQTRGERTWFIKLDGPTKLVGENKEKFESLTRSIKFK